MEPKNDVDAGVLATGCGWTCGLGCGLVAVLLLLGLILGVSKTGEGATNFLVFLGFLGGAIANVAVGFFTARAARAERVGPNLHVIVLGLVVMVVGLISFVLPEWGRETEGWIRLLSVLSWLGTIPLMLFGANLAQEEAATDESNRARAHESRETLDTAPLPKRLQVLPPEIVEELRQKIRAHDLNSLENRIFATLATRD